jgi:NitT/TauT family transport system substrate-binding protein
MKLADVEPVYLTVDESEQAFIKGKVDGVVTFEPFRTRLLRQGAREVFTSSEIPGEIVDVLVVRNKVLQDREKAIRNFTTAWFKALDYLKKKPRLAAALIGERLNLSADEVIASFDGLSLPDVTENHRLLGSGEGSLIQAANNLAKVMSATNLLAGKVAADVMFDSAGLRLNKGAAR